MTRNKAIAAAASFAALVAIVIMAIATNGQIGKSIASALRYGDIPVGDHCVTLGVDEGAVLPTRDMAVSGARLIASDPTDDNISKLEQAMVDKYGDVLTSIEAAVICASADRTQVATLDNVNLGW